MKFTTTQQEQVESELRAGARIIRYDAVPVVAAIRTLGDRIVVRAWEGNRSAPSFCYAFKTSERAAAHLEEFIAAAKWSAAFKAAEKAKTASARAALKASDHWAVGDVVYTSWGYDQTNVEFYQITRVLARSVEVREIGANCSDHGGPSGGKTAPVRGQFIGPAYLCPLNPHGHFSAGPCYGKDKPSFRHCAHKWLGGAQYTSSYH